MQRQGRDALELIPLKTPKRRSLDRLFGVFTLRSLYNPIASLLVRFSKLLKLTKSTALRKRAILVIAFLLVPSGVLLNGFNQRTAYAAPSTYLNFQARLMASAGNLVPDGTYNIEFKIYNASSSSGSSQGSCSGDSNCVWVETRTGGNKVNVVNGYFSINLGSVTAFSGMDWSQQHWLTMNIGGTGSPSWDGEMTPRIQLTAVPIAFVANNVNSGNTSTSSTNSANTTIQSGNATGATSNSGNVLIDAGSATGTAGTISLGASNASAITLGRSGVTTTNSGALTVTQLGTFNGKLYVNSATTADSTAQVLVATGGTANKGLVIQGVSGQSAAFFNVQRYDGGQVFIIKSDGSFTANSTTNYANLDFNAPNAELSLGYGGAVSGSIVLQDGSGGGSATQLITSAGQFIIQNSSTNYAGVKILGPTGSYTSANTLTVKASSGQTGKALEIQNSSGTPIMNISTTGAALFQNSTNSTTAFSVQNASTASILNVDTTNGRVGIGTNAPGYLLDVRDSSASGSFLVQAYNTNNASSLANAIFALRSGGSSGGDAFLHTVINGEYAWNAGVKNSDNSYRIGNDDNGSLSDATTKFIINTSGNVGVGTVTPTTAKLQIDGVTGTTVGLQVNNGTSTGNILTLQDNGSDVLTVLDGGATIFKNASDSTAALRVQNANGTSLFSIDTATSSNLISNGSFETAISGWSAKGAAGSPAQSASNGYDLGSSMSVATTGANQGAYYSYTLSASTAYTLSMYVKVSSGSISSGNFVIGHQDQSGTDIDCTQVGLTAGIGQNITSTGWTRLVCAFSSGGTISSSNIYFKQADATTRTIYVDGVQLVAAANEAPFTQGGRIATSAIFTNPIAIQTAENGTNTLTVTATDGTNVVNVDSVNKTLTVGNTSSNQNGTKIAAGNIYLKSAGYNTTATFSGSSGLYLQSDYGSANVVVLNSSSTQVGLTVKGASSQSGNLLVLQDSSGNTNAAFNSNGAQLSLGRASNVSGGLVMYNASGAGSITLQAANPSSSNYTITLPAETGTICTTGSVCSGYASSSTAFIQDGNSFGGTATLGTNDSYNLAFETAGTARLIIASTGEIRTESNDIRLKVGGDVAHGLGYYGTGKTYNSLALDGPVLYGYSGGILGGSQTYSGVAALRWSSFGTVKIGDVTSDSSQANLFVRETSPTSSGAITVTASNGASSLTLSSSMSLYAGDYLVPTTSTGQARQITSTGYGTSFNVSQAFSANVTTETFSIYRQTLRVSNSSGSDALTVQGYTNNASFDSGTLYVDAVNNLVGVGTTSPGAKLEVSGLTGSTIGAIINNGTSTGDILRLQDNGSSVFTVADGGAITTTSTINSQTISSSANFTGTLAVNGASVTVGTASSTNGNLILQNATNAYTLTINAPNQTIGSATVALPDTAGVSDTFCLVTLANCGGAGGGVTTIGALDGGSANANAAYISGTTLYLQSASASYAGLVNTTTQSFAGDKTFTGNVSIQGNTTLGNATSDTVTFTGRVSSDILPTTDDTYNLGDDTHRWANLYLGGETLHIGTAVGDEGTLGYTTSSDVLSLQSTGTISLANNTSITGTLAVNGASVTVGTASSTNGTLVLQNSTNAYTTTITASNTASSSKTITLPNETGTICTTGSICSGYQGTVSIGGLNGGTANANAATLTSGTLYLQSASASYAGLVDTASQTFGGVKTFNDGTLIASGQSYSGAGAVTVSSASATTLTLDSGTTGSVLVGTGASAKTVTLGSATTTSTTNIQSGSGNINLIPGAGNDVIFSQGAGSNLQLTASAAPTVSQLAITNTGQAVTTSDVNGISVNYVGGAAAVEAAGVRVDLTPGTTTGGTWSGMRIVANSTGAVTGVTEYGIKIEGPSSPGSGTETGLYIGTNWDTGLDVQSGGINLAGFTSGGNPSDPSAPAGDNLRVYAKKVSGRMLLKIKGPSGLDSPLQPALFGNNVILYAPTSSTTVTGGFGTLWAKGSSSGTVSHPTPATTSPAMTNQMHRTRHQNVVTTTNQAMGIRSSATDAFQFWMGNGSGLGGFFFNTRFVVEAYPASTVRIFAGLASTSTEVVASDTVANDVVGLWHDTTDPSSGANSFNLVTRNNTTTTKKSIALSNAIAAGNSYDWFMFVKPNDSTVYYRLDDLVNGVSYEGSTSTTTPRSTVFMAPQVEMSNGTANTTVGTVAIGVARVYVESDH